MLKDSLIFFVLVLSTGVVNAQRTKLTYDDYTARKPKICTQIPNPVSATKNDVIYSDGKPSRTKLTVYEIESYDRMRETSSSEGLVQIVVTLPDFIYKKINDAKWEKMDWYYRHPLTEEEIEILGSDEYWTESVQLDGKKVTILATSILQIVGGKKGYKQEELFFDASAGCIKTVETYGHISPRSVRRQITFTSVHDPSIKIEAPIR